MISYHFITCKYVTYCRKFSDLAIIIIKNVFGSDPYMFIFPGTVAGTKKYLITKNFYNTSLPII